MAKNKAERDETGGPDLLLVFLTVLLVVVGVFELYILSCIGVKAVTALKDGAGVTLAASSQSQQTGADEATEPPAGGSASEETPDTSGQETATETEPVDATEPEPETEPETEPVDTTEPEPPAEELAPEPSGAETSQEDPSGESSGGSSAEAVDLEQAFRESLMQYNYVGSAESDKYHYPSCRWTNEINDENLVYFDTVSEAAAAGYLACGTCEPV